MTYLTESLIESPYLISILLISWINSTSFVCDLNHLKCIVLVLRAIVELIRSNELLLTDLDWKLHCQLITLLYNNPWQRLELWRPLWGSRSQRLKNNSGEKNEIMKHCLPWHEKGFHSQRWEVDGALRFFLQ